MKKPFWTFSEFLMFFIVSSILVYFFMITIFPAAAGNNNTGEIKTALIATLTGIISYQFGSSKSSAKKDEAISDALKEKSNSVT